MRTQTDINHSIKNLERRVAYRARQLKTTVEKLEEKHFNIFSRQAQYLGGDSYEWCGVYSTDTRELFLKGLLIREGRKVSK